jgi:hypothetical protein
MDDFNLNENECFEVLAKNCEVVNKIDKLAVRNKFKIRKTQKC